jgi:hypothetical protein
MTDDLPLFMPLTFVGQEWNEEANSEILPE